MGRGVKYCRLCQSKVADKTGSHIIPHLILKNVDNEAGITSRDKELGFKIGDSGVESYFGRSIQPEKIQDILGDFEVEELGKTELIVDYLFCNGCELFFSEIESKYAGSKLSSNKSPEVSFLFWVSIFWRVSLIELGWFRLSQKHERMTHRVLNASRLLTSPNNSLSEIGYRVIKCKDVPEKFPSGIFFHPIHKMPYVAIIGEYVLQLYFKKSYLRTVEKGFFGFEKFLCNEQLSTRTKVYEPGNISVSAYKAAMDRLLLWLHNRQDLNWRFKLDNVFFQLGLGNKMPESIKRQVINKLHNSELPMGRKYQKEEVGAIIYSELVRLGYIK